MAADRPGPGRARPWADPVTVRLSTRLPHDVVGTVRFHGLHAVPGVETWDGTVFRRTLRLPGGPARVSVAASGGDGFDVGCEVCDPSDLDDALGRVRAMLDLDADPVAIDSALAGDPALAPLVTARPGVRSPGVADGDEAAVRTVVGQQVSLAGARTVLGRIAAAYGQRVASDAPDLLFPSAAVLAGLDPAVLPLPRARGRALVGLSAAAHAGRVVLDADADADVQTAALLALPGIGPWTAQYLRMRVFRDPDVLLGTDLAVRRVAEELGVDLTDSARFAPWRSYVTHHLWAVVLSQV